MKKFGKRESIDPNDSNLECKKTFKELRNMLINKGKENTFFEHEKKDIQSIEVEKELDVTYTKCFYEKITDFLLFVYKKVLDVVEKEKLANIPVIFFEFLDFLKDKDIIETINLLRKHKGIFRFADACFLCNLKLKNKHNQVYLFLCIKIFCLMRLIEEIIKSLQNLNSKLLELFKKMYERYIALLKSFVESKHLVGQPIDLKESLYLILNRYYLYESDSHLENGIKLDQQFIKELIDIMTRIIYQENSIRDLVHYHIHNFCLLNPLIGVVLQDISEGEKYKSDNRSTLQNNKNLHKFKLPEKSLLLDYSDSSDEYDILSLSNNKSRLSLTGDKRHTIEKNYFKSFEEKRNNFECYRSIPREHEKVSYSKEFYEGTPLKKKCIRGRDNYICLSEYESPYQSQENLYRQIVKIDHFDQINKKNDSLYDCQSQKFKDVCRGEFFNDEIVSRISVSKEINNREMSQDLLVKKEKFDFKSSTYTPEEIYKLLKINYMKFSDLPQNIVKISEASFSEVFKHRTDIYKIIPLGANYTQEHEFLQEAFIQFCLSKEDGICKLKVVCIVEGKYTESYLNAWDKFGFLENERPSKYPCKQKYGVLIMENGGESLEEYKFKTVNEIVVFIKELIRHLSELELRYEFEHRDLHWGNILIKNKKINIIDFTLARIKKTKIVFNDLTQKQWLFEGDPNIDEQFLVYKEMKNASKGDWLKFNPVTNVLWLRYIINKSFSKLKTPKSEKFKNIFLEIVNNCCSVVKCRSV